MLESLNKAPTVPELASDYVEIIRQHQPHGPYRLAGLSFGGIVAYEVAQQLRASCEEVAFVGLIDAILPDSGVRYRVGQLARLFALPLRDAVRVTVKRTLRRVAARLGVGPRSELTRYDSPEKLAPLDHIRQEAYARAAERYVSQIQPLTGNIELIVAGRRLADDPLQTPDCGWSNHVSSVRVHVLDADHLGLVEEPGVASLAEVFLEGLHRSDNQRPSREHDDGQAPAGSISGVSGNLLGQST